MLRHSLSIILFSLLAASAMHAQFINYSAPKPDPHESWPAPSNHPGYGTLELVTLSKPGVRQHCRVHAITTDTIVCGVGIARHPVTFQRDDVAALIYPIDHSGEHLFFVCTALAVAGTVVAAIFLPPLAAVAIGIPSIYLGLSTAMATDGDSDSESILYHRPDTPLTIRLR